MYKRQVEESDRRGEAARHLTETLTRYEQELIKMRKDAEAVSYTHLDVYKRQLSYNS